MLNDAYEYFPDRGRAQAAICQKQQFKQTKKGLIWLYSVLTWSLISYNITFYTSTMNNFKSDHRVH